MSDLIANNNIDKAQQAADLKRAEELHKDKTIEIDANHPLAIAADRALKAHEEGRLLPISDAIQMLIDEKN